MDDRTDTTDNKDSVTHMDQTRAMTPQENDHFQTSKQTNKNHE